MMMIGIKQKQSFDYRYKVILCLCIAILCCSNNLKFSTNVIPPKDAETERWLLNNEDNYNHKKGLRSAIVTSNLNNGNITTAVSIISDNDNDIDNVNNNDNNNNNNNNKETNKKGVGIRNSTVITTTTNTTTNTNTTKTCLNSNGPIPVLLMVHGRSGSTVLWQVLSNLTGFEGQAVEATGSYSRTTRNFFTKTSPNGEWMLDFLCKKQRQAIGVYNKQKRWYRQAGRNLTNLSLLHERIVGLQWKPFFDSIYLPRAQEALQMLSNLSAATSKNPTVAEIPLLPATTTTTTTTTATTVQSKKLNTSQQGPSSSSLLFIRVIRSRRNPVDVTLSNMKHYMSHGKISYKCEVGNTKCLEEHAKRARGIVVENVTKFYNDIHNFYTGENKVDEMLRNYQIPTIFVSYEKLFYPKESYYNNTNTITTTSTTTTATTTTTVQNDKDENTNNNNNDNNNDDDLLLANEWNKILQFLGVSKYDWKWKEIQAAAKMAATTSSRSHKDLISNYDEVYNVFKGTDIEYLLRP